MGSPIDESESPFEVVAALQELQLPHAKLMYILARMYKLQMVTETQKLELKYRVLQKHQGLMDFVTEHEELCTVSGLWEREDDQNEYVQTCFTNLETF